MCELTFRTLDNVQVGRSGSWCGLSDQQVPTILILVPSIEIAIDPAVLDHEALGKSGHADIDRVVHGSHLEFCPSSVEGESPDAVGLCVRTSG